MAQLDIYPYETLSGGAQNTSPVAVETQQPGGSGSTRQVMVVGDATTRANMQKVTANGEALISQLDTTVTASLTATDALAGAPAGTGALISTAPTAGSFVAMAIPGGGSQVDVMIKGTPTGTYYFEHSMNSTNGSDGDWIATNFRQTGIVNTVLGYSTTAAGVYRGNSAGFNYVRVRNVGGTAPTNAITIRVTNGSGTTFLNASIPAGSNNIGTVQNGAVDINGNPTLVRTDSGGRTKISHGQPALTTGTLGALSAISAIASDGFSDALFYFSGTTVQTVTFEQSPDSTDGTNGTWYPVLATNQGSNTAAASTAALTGVHTYRVSAPGAAWVHAKTTAFTSGSSAVQMVITTAMAQSQVTTTPSATTAISGSLTTLTTLTTITNGVKSAVNTTAGGATSFTLISAATTNGTLIGTAAARTLYGIQAFNNGAAVAYVKVYAKATAPTVGTDTPVMTLAIPAGGGFVWSAPPQGVAVALGLGVGITGGNTVADTTAVALSQVNLNVQYA